MSIVRLGTDNSATIFLLLKERYVKTNPKGGIRRQAKFTERMVLKSNFFGWLKVLKMLTIVGGRFLLHLNSSEDFIL